MGKGKLQQQMKRIQVKSEFHRSGNIYLKAIRKVIASIKAVHLYSIMFERHRTDNGKNGVLCFSLSLCIFYSTIDEAQKSLCIFFLNSILVIHCVWFYGAEQN